MKISQQKLMEVAGETGFKPDALEKVIRLLDLLNHIFESDDVRTKFVLKGGTALNLFIFDVPRLKRQLIPVLRARDLAAKKDDEQMLSNLIKDCGKFVGPLFPLSSGEREFIATLRENGLIAAELITADKDLIQKISMHPGLLRRAAAARKRIGG